MIIPKNTVDSGYMVHVYPGKNWLYSRNDHISEDHITENWPKFDHITGTQCITTCLGSVPALVTDKPCSPCSLRRICEGCFAFRFRRTFKLTIGDPKCNIHFSKGGRSSFPPLVHTLAKGLLLPLLASPMREFQSQNCTQALMETC